MSIRPQLLIFDWDGTLLDSADKITRCMQLAAADCGQSSRSPGEIRNIIGLELGLAIARLYPELGATDLLSLREAYVTRFLEADQRPCSFFIGVSHTLQRLHEAGYILCVATGKSRRGLDRVMAHLPESRFFSASRCADETASKPDPLMLQELCDEFAVAPQQAVMIGDTEYDLEMAARLDMPRVGVSYGAHGAARLRVWQPLAVIDEFSLLVDLL